MPVLVHFMQCLEMPNAAFVLTEAKTYLPALDAWLNQQVVAPQDRNWLLTRLGYFVGEYLVQELGGCWFLNDVPDSKYFGRYVVGGFARASNANTMVDAFAVAEACVDDPRAESLLSLLTDVENSVR